jgi:virulence factor Mce-like protein
MRRALATAVVVTAAAAFFVFAGGSSNGPSDPTYRIELDNAFGLVNGATFKVAGVPAGSIQSIDLCVKQKHSGCENPLDALVTVQVTESGFGQFRSDAFCQSRPQSLIGEYFLECQPGQYGQPLAPGSTIPVSRTQSTIPADLVNDVMRMPYRERFTLIINELGAAVAGRSDDLRAALQRAVPALTETDNLLNLLANDARTLQQLNVNADQVITALANNSAQVQRFIVEANNTASDTATQAAAFKSTWAQLPGFLEQLKPAMADLGAAADANTPVLANLNAASGQLARLFRDLPGFAHSSLISLRGPHPCGAVSCNPSLGQASVTGRAAVIAATPTVEHLNQFAKPTPELAQNLAIVLGDLDNRSRAVEPDSRSPGGRGYTGLEALLQYVFNQALAINTFGPMGHLLAVDAFIDPLCSPYASPQTIANNLATNGSQYRRCYSWLGPNQPGVNETDPSNPNGCVPDPGGAPPGEPGPRTNACKLKANPLLSAVDVKGTSASPSSKTSGGKAPPGSTSGSSGGSGGGLPAALGKFISSLGSASSSSGSTGGSTGTTSSQPVGSSTSQAQQLLKYLLAP